MRGVTVVRGLCAALALGALCCAAPCGGADARTAGKGRTLLLLPVASGTPGQERTALALGEVLEDGLTSVAGVRLVAGAAREAALRELSARDTMTAEEFFAACRRAGADLAALGGSTYADGRLALELRVFDVGAGRELQTFHGEDELARAFELAAAAIRHVAAAADLGAVEVRFPRGVTGSLEAYAAYRAALLEAAPAARIEKLRAAIGLDPSFLDATLRLGVELFRQGPLDEALGVLERAAALGPKVAEARNNFGVALAAAGRSEQAQREFEEAVALAPGYAEARLNLARVLEDRGLVEEAEREYAAVLAADAGNDKARFGLAALYDRTGRPELALKEFRQLSARRPDLAEAEFIRVGQEARKAREYARAEKYFLRAADVNPQFAPAWAELGTNSYLAGEFAKGVGYFRKALAIDPGQAAYHYYLALALDKDRQPDEALREYRRAVELGGPPEARLGLARAALDAGDPAVAVEELNRLLAANPDHAEAKILLAQATAELEARRRLVEGQSQFANQRLARLEQIVADANRANRDLEARLLAVTQEKRLLEERQRPGAVPGAASPGSAEPSSTAPQAEGGPVPVDARELDRLRRELTEERDARRREAADAQAALALLRADKERIEKDLAEVKERPVREVERLQADLAAAQATARELGRGSGEVEELRLRLAGLQAEQARLQTESGQERETRRLELERVRADLAAEREARRVEADRCKADQAAAQDERGRLAIQANEAAEVRGRLRAAEGALAKADATLKAERERGERALAAEREARRDEVEKLRGEIASGQFKRQEKERMSQDLAAARAQAAAAGEAREKSEQALAAESARFEKALAAERAARREQVEKLTADLAAQTASAQDRERLAQELAAEQGRGRAELEARMKLEQTCAAYRDESERTLAAERERQERAVAAEREERRRDGSESAARIGALETQVRAQAEAAQARDRELAAAIARERDAAAELAKVGADRALILERQTALEARAAAETRTLAEREQALEKARQTLRDLALELGRIALRTQSWEKAVGYLERVVEIDPRNGEAWYGLGEAFFQVGQYEKSKLMYQKAKEIY